jgi:hypothetical protein
MSKLILIIFTFTLTSFNNFVYADSKHNHQHSVIEAVAPYPTLDVEVLQDAKSGFNLIIKTTNFAFTPLSVNQANNGNEGHAHIYINDVKYRQYSPYFHLSNDLLLEGENEIRVTLNSNDHSELAINNSPIAIQFEVMAMKGKSMKKEGHHGEHKDSHSHN